MQVITDGEVSRGVSDETFSGRCRSRRRSRSDDRSPSGLGRLPGRSPVSLRSKLVLLARSELAAVCVTRISAYPTGFAFDLLTVSDADAGARRSLTLTSWGFDTTAGRPGVLTASCASACSSPTD